MLVVSQCFPSRWKNPWHCRTSLHWTTKVQLSSAVQHQQNKAPPSDTGLALSIKKNCNSPFFESALSTSSSKYISMAAQRLMLLLLIRLLSRLGCKTDSGSFRANSLETSELVPAEVIALWKIHPQPWKRYLTPTQAGLRSSLLNFNDRYPMSVSCLSGHSLERHYTYLMMDSLKWTDIYTLSSRQKKTDHSLVMSTT